MYIHFRNGKLPAVAMAGCLGLVWIGQVSKSGNTFHRSFSMVWDMKYLSFQNSETSMRLNHDLAMVRGPLAGVAASPAQIDGQSLTMV